MARSLGRRRARILSQCVGKDRGRTMSARQDFAASIEAANLARRHAVSTAASTREAEIRVALIVADREYTRRLEKADSDHHIAVTRAAAELCELVAGGS